MDRSGCLTSNNDSPQFFFLNSNTLQEINSTHNIGATNFQANVYYTSWVLYKTITVPNDFSSVYIKFHIAAPNASSSQGQYRNVAWDGNYQYVDVVAFKVQDTKITPNGWYTTDVYKYLTCDTSTSKNIEIYLTGNRGNTNVSYISRTEQLVIDYTIISGVVDGHTVDANTLPVYGNKQ